MCDQLSLFGQPHTEDIGAPVDAGALSCVAKDACGYVSVIVDIPARALSEPFAYGVGEGLYDRARIGSTVLVSFGRQMALGYVVARADRLDELPGTGGLEKARIKHVRDVLARPCFAEKSARIAFWMAREYIASVAECLRLFLPPGGTPRLQREASGRYRIVRPAVNEVHERWVSLTDAGKDYTPPERAVRQRQLLAALSCGPVTTRELNLLYTDMSAPIRALSSRGIVAVEERRRVRGMDPGTTLSSAVAKAPLVHTAGQLHALEAIEAVRATGEGGVVLVDGVTGSGKTEVYLSAIERVLDAGETACVLVPEISLTAQTVGRFRSRFGSSVAVFHSRLSAGERLDQWNMVQRGEAHVVVGARSALFCPLGKLGIIIIDEEHEQSYKQGSAPRYHAREVAMRMSREYGCPLVLGSATPSAESLERCAIGEYGDIPWTRVEMRERPGGARLPEVIVSDMRREFAAGSRSIFSRPLYDALMGVIERREKAVLLHNRRGFAPFLMCRDCGCVPTCKHCSTALTYHERTHTLECHTCGAVYHVRPYPAPGSACPRCGSRYLAKMGLGTQQVEDALLQLVPDDVAVIRMDADSTRGKDAHKKLLEQFDAADCAILLGTQMIAKGLDFPEVTLVGVINADHMLKMPDFRASERAYDLLEQVAGRAGRGDRPGRVVIQTYLPQDPVIRAVAEHDRSIFLDHDALQRREAMYPPYVRLTNVLVWGSDESATKRYVEQLAARVAQAFAAIQRNVSVPSDALPSLAGDATAGPTLLGPVPCVTARAKDRYRFHFICKTPVGYHISDAMSTALASLPCPGGVHVSVDVDAYDLM